MIGECAREFVSGRVARSGAILIRELTRCRCTVKSKFEYIYTPCSMPVSCVCVEGSVLHPKTMYYESIAAKGNPPPPPPSQGRPTAGECSQAEILLAHVSIDKTAASMAGLLPQNLSRASCVCFENIFVLYVMLLCCSTYYCNAVAEQVKFFRSSDVLRRCPPPPNYNLDIRRYACDTTAVEWLMTLCPVHSALTQENLVLSIALFLQRVSCPVSLLSRVTYVHGRCASTKRTHTQREAPSPRWARRNTAWHVSGSNNVSVACTCSAPVRRPRQITRTSLVQQVVLMMYVSGCITTVVVVSSAVKTPSSGTLDLVYSSSSSSKGLAVPADVNAHVKQVGTWSNPLKVRQKTKGCRV